jgi:serine/threonine-protein kinase
MALVEPEEALGAGGPVGLSPGEVFAERYRIEKRLESGRASQVFAAVDVDDGRGVAIKVFHPRVLASTGAIKRFELAMGVARDLSGDHLASILDAGVDPFSHVPFVVTELLSGETLEDRVRKRGPLEVDELLTCMRQLAAGLEVGHAYADDSLPERGPVVHGNLKPGSIYLTQRNNATWVMILDFGLAEGLEHARGSISRGRLRPPLYTAYEQLCGYAVTSRADIWALGLVAFFMLTGQHYWRASDGDLDDARQRRVLFDEVLNLPLVDPSARAAELGCGGRVSAAFDAWFARCLDRDPEQRFVSAGSAVQELELVLLRGPTSMMRLSPRSFRVGRWVIVALVLCAALVASILARR